MDSYTSFRNITDLHDYSTTNGKFRLFVSKINWRWVIFTIFISSLIVLPYLLGKEAPTGNEPFLGQNLQAILKAKAPLASEFQYNGPEGTLTTFSGYNEIASRNPATLTSLTIRNAYIDAPTFSQTCQPLVNLRTITLDNVSLLGNLTRIVLPKLTQFTYKQNQDDKRDSYKSPTTLKETLFFDKSTNGTWDVETDLLNLGIVLKISKAGTKLIEVNRPIGEVYLNIKYCHNVLSNLQGDISTLTLINCNTTDELSLIIPHNLKYLNLRNTIPSSVTLQQIIKPQTQLVEFYGYFNFHCDWPGYEIILNIADLPKTTKKIGINNMDLSSTPGFKSTITDFSIGDFINPQIVQDFDQIFVNVKRVGVFNISIPFAYPLLKNILKTNVESIALVNFEREVEKNETLDGLEMANLVEIEQVIQEVEGILSKYSKLSPTDEDILIETKGLGLGRPLLEAEKHSLRYKGLGFDKMDTLEDYLLWDALKLPNKSDKITPSVGLLFAFNVFALFYKVNF